MILILLLLFSFILIYVSCLYLACIKYSFVNLTKIENASEIINSLIIFFYISACFSFILSLFYYVKETKSGVLQKTNKDN